MKNGIGDYYYKSGDHYKGSFVDDMKEGKGTMSYTNKDKYHG
jgi:hypothetical protein